MDFHVRYTHSLPKFDPKVFIIVTPKKVTSDYIWIFDPIDGVAPSNKQIIYDTYYLLASINYSS